MATEKYKKLLTEFDARKAIKSGIRKATEVVAPTLGVKGRKIAMDSEFARLEIIDDGYMILRGIELEDTAEQIGVKLLRDASTSTNDNAGDGTSSTVVIVNKLVQEVVEDGDPLLINKNRGNILTIRKQIEIGQQKLMKAISKATVALKDEKISDVGTVSSNNRQIGDILQVIFSKLGKDASVLVQDSHSLDTMHEFIEGMKMDKGWISPAMITNGDTEQAELTNARVLVTDHKVHNPQDIETLLRLFKGGVNDLLIIADTINGMPLDFLVANKAAGAIRVVGVNGPSLGNMKDYLEDVAVFTGATMISKDNNLTFADVTEEHLGRAVSVVSTNDSTTLAGGAGSKDDVSTRVKALEHQMKEKGDSKYDQEKLKDRISNLRGGVGIIKVGGATETEVNEKKAKIDDAVNAVRAAMKEGIVPGGGVMLLRAAQELDRKGSIGEKALANAVMAPFEQLIENANFDATEASEKILKNDNHNYGFNVETEKYCDMMEEGIVDPALVVKTAVNNAISTAMLVQAIAGANTVVRKKDEKGQLSGPQD